MKIATATARLRRYRAFPLSLRSISNGCRRSGAFLQRLNFMHNLKQELIRSQNCSANQADNALERWLKIEWASQGFVDLVCLSKRWDIRRIFHVVVAIIRPIMPGSGWSGGVEPQHRYNSNTIQGNSTCRRHRHSSVLTWINYAWASRDANFVLNTSRSSLQ